MPTNMPARGGSAFGGKHITASEQETLRLGEKLAKDFKGGEVLAVTGDLGAGKTILTKGVARGLGIKKIITSPTFVLMNVIPVTNNVIKKLVHIDCYRLSQPSDLENIGATEYFGQPDTVVVIEWADKIKKILPKSRTSISIVIKDKNSREITIS